MNIAEHLCILNISKTRPKIYSFRDLGERIRTILSPSSLLILSSEKMYTYSCVSHPFFYSNYVFNAKIWRNVRRKVVEAPGMNAGLRSETPTTNSQSSAT
jgi:hypothetical protein